MGTLRQALTYAAGGDTITFNLVYPAVIPLATTLNILTNVTIAGPGAGFARVSER